MNGEEFDAFHIVFFSINEKKNYVIYFHIFFFQIILINKVYS